MLFLFVIKLKTHGYVYIFNSLFILMGILLVLENGEKITVDGNDTFSMIDSMLVSKFYSNPYTVTTTDWRRHFYSQINIQKIIN